MSQTQVSAHSNTGIEGFDTEVNCTVDISQVGQLYSQRFVHWSKMNDGVRIDVVLIKSPSGLVQPFILTWPPDSVV